MIIERLWGSLEYLSHLVKISPYGFSPTIGGAKLVCTKGSSIAPRLCMWAGNVTGSWMVHGAWESFSSVLEVEIWVCLVRVLDDSLRRSSVSARPCDVHSSVTLVDRKLKLGVVVIMFHLMLWKWRELRRGHNKEGTTDHSIYRSRHKSIPTFEAWVRELLTSRGR